MFVRLFSVLILLGLTGCSNSGYSVKDDFDNPYTKNLYKSLEVTVANSHYDEQSSNLKLAESAAAISQSLQELARIQRSVHDVDQVRDDPNIIKVKLGGRTNVDWTGPLDTFLKKVAQTGNLQYRALGNAPAIPIIVSVNERDILLTDLIRNVAYQVQNQASVTLTKDKVIQLQYLKN